MHRIARTETKGSTLGLAAFCAVIAALPCTGQNPSDKPKAVPAVETPPINAWLREQSPSWAAWDIGVQLRARYERKDDGGSDGRYAADDFLKETPPGRFNDNAFLLLREKIHVGYTPVSWCSVFLEGRDSSSTGDRRDPNPGADVLDLHQAYLRLGQRGDFPLIATLGRQELLYADERMVGIGDWGNLGRVFDAAKLRWDGGDYWVDAFAARMVIPDNHNFNLSGDYDVLTGVYASSKGLLPFQETQVYALGHHVEADALVVDPAWLSSPARPQDTFTIGFRAQSIPGKLGNWDYAAEAAGQLGTVNAVNRRLDQLGWNTTVSGGYTWKSADWQPRLGLGYDFASGDNDPTDDQNGTFLPLFPTNHKVYGLMDLVGPRNLHDPRIVASVRPLKTLTIAAEFHGFWLATTEDFFYPEGGAARARNGYGRNSQFDSFVGTEFDLDVTWRARSWLTFRAGYGHFFVGSYVQSSLANSGGATDADWVYLQTSLNL
ncbi:MAG: alginate export family protein [Verrucomicrobiales bacterium]|nr:alginate export family protein [Verrucomicrobiales bacterium]